MTKRLTSRDIQTKFGMKPNLAEGGFYSLTQVSQNLLPNDVLASLPNADPLRTLSSGIFYHISQASPSRMHRVMGDIIYHFYAGDPIEMLLIYPDGHFPSAEFITFGNDIAGGQTPVKVIPGGTWMGSRMLSDGDWALMGVTMSPGFHPIDYHIAENGELEGQYPAYANFMESLRPRQSFYIFDIDENILVLETKIQVVKVDDESEIRLISQEEYAKGKVHLKQIEGRMVFTGGDLESYALFAESFKYFEDSSEPEQHSYHYFVSDIEIAVKAKTFKGPSWDVLEYAIKNKRPIAVITARGHSSDTIVKGFEKLVELGQLSDLPKVEVIYCVNHPHTRNMLNKTASAEEKSKGRLDTKLRKRIAARVFVQESVKKYGTQPNHKFGMSDDDPGNVYNVIQAMSDSKEAYPHMRFYVINTHHGDHVKMEVEPLKPV